MHPLDAAACPYAVLVVDDDDAHRRLVRHILAGPTFSVAEAADGEQALQLVGRLPLDAVLVDFNMPGLSGPEFCQRVRSLPGFELLPLIMLTGRGATADLIRCLNSGATDFVRKPYQALELEARVRGAAERKRITDQLDDAESILFALAHLVEARDGVTGDHCVRLTTLASRFSAELGLSAEQRDALRRAAVLHDLGKIAIPDAILLKEGPLDEAEWQVMKRHPVIGAELCSSLHSLAMTIPVIRHHHERWDGSGYPGGLAGKRIPLLARVFQIVDVFDALAHERPYKLALPHDEALAVMRAEAGAGKLDPELTRRFAECAEGDPAFLAGIDAPSAGAHAAAVRRLMLSGVLRGTRFPAPA